MSEIQTVILDDVLRECEAMIPEGESRFSRPPDLLAISELAARLFPVPGLEMEDRAEEIAVRILMREWD
jgi:hypothetical protein